MSSERRGTRSERGAKPQVQYQYTWNASDGSNVKICAVALCVLIFVVHDTATAAAFTFNDIEFWVGTGSNRAALVVDWLDGVADPPALAWGYRWDGSATGADMLSAIVAADTRLFAKFGGSPGNLSALYGLGYDADDDGQFALDDATQFDAEGLAYTGPADSAVVVDLGDQYAEGWFTGFWHYGVPTMEASNPYAGGEWRDIPFGMTGRALSDGSWDSWTYSSTFNFAAFADNPAPAASPYPIGDFDRDYHVGANDYTAWRAAFGSVTDPEIDASRNGAVDAADYVVWRMNFTAPEGTARTTTTSTPEASTWQLAIAALVAFAFRSSRCKRETIS